MSCRIWVDFEGTEAPANRVANPLRNGLRQRVFISFPTVSLCSSSSGTVYVGFFRLMKPACFEVLTIFKSTPLAGAVGRDVKHQTNRNAPKAADKAAASLGFPAVMNGRYRII